ncbi:MAG TPA: peptidoglycan-binding protein [Polyangiaceae bacterium]|nr:peptidoglycan-binding protein [Polyangiaceae bacterium]
MIEASDTNAPIPVWLVNYENTDVSNELAGMLVSVDYTDHVQGSADQLTLTVEDGVGRWREGWWPDKDDRISVKMGMKGQALLDAGQFSVDECELKGPPYTASISALSAPQTGNLRTKENRAFEGLTLAELAGQMATELSLNLIGDVADVYLGRVTQNAETTVAFMRRLSESYGYAFSIRPPNLVFYELLALEAAPPTITIDRTSLGAGWSLKGSVQETYVACEASYLDPATGELLKVRVEAAHIREAVLIGASPQASEALPLPTKTLRFGDTGEQVEWWQTFLIAQGYDTGGLDGIFGTITRRSTMAFQRKMSITVDGIVGPETRRAAVAAGYSNTDASPGAATSGRVLRLKERFESQQQAELRARAELAAANRLRVKGRLPLPGDNRVVSGATINLTGLGRLSGKYLVSDAMHKVARSGWTCEAEVTYV